VKEGKIDCWLSMAAGIDGWTWGIGTVFIDRYFKGLDWRLMTGVSGAMFSDTQYQYGV
jgi:hypothetical protein